MNAKALTESGWKGVVSKSKVKDNGLQRALASYEKLDEEKHDERIKAIGIVCQLANALTKVKDLAEDAADYLEEVVDAAEAEKASITKEQAAAEKADAEAKKKEKAAEDENENEDEDEQEDAD